MAYRAPGIAKARQQRRRPRVTTAEFFGLKSRPLVLRKRTVKGGRS